MYERATKFRKSSIAEPADAAWVVIGTGTTRPGRLTAMPIERRTSSAQVRALLIAVVSLIFVVTLGYAVFRATTGQRSSVTSAGTSGTWVVGDAESKARLIADDGPILIPDPAGAQRLPIFISHTGASATTGWHAFEARPPDAPDDCFLRWDADQDRFTAPCDSATFGADGDGLRQFSATVTADGDLVVDLTPKSAPVPSEPTTTI